MILRSLFGASLIAIGTTAAIAGSPSTILSMPTLRPIVPIAPTAVVPAAEAPAATPACDLKQVMQVDSGKGSGRADRFAIDSYGESESAGWKSPQLRFVRLSTDKSVAILDFVGCRPEVSAQVVTPVEAHAALALDPATKRVVIRSRTNMIAVELRQ
jgi:hypothetical protein